MAKFSISSEKTILHADLFDVHQIEIVKESGEKATWHNVLVKPVVYVLALNERNEVYLIEQYRYVLKKMSLEIPAGYINDNEDPLDAAKRELKEETGVSAEKWTALGVRKIGTTAVTGDVYYYLAEGLHSGEQHLDDTEDIRVIVTPLADAVEKAANGGIFVNGNVAGLFLLREYLTKKGLF